MDRYNLARFHIAQADIYREALGEIRQGAKHGHWMWFIFPQLAGLGHSETARHFAIASLEEAHAYLADPVLGGRLLECLAALMALTPQTSAETVFGPVDAMKLRSSLTLFAAAGGGAAFTAALERWCDGPDARTLELLAGTEKGAG